MSGGELYTAVTALKAQSNALSAISTNLANSSTTGYKAVDVSFSDLVTGSSIGSTNSFINGSGVIAGLKQLVTTQGTIESSSISTNVAINGDGMFVVSNGQGGTTFYTRDGDFQPDAKGNLVNGNYYLQGWPTDSSGTVTSSTLQSINVNTFNTSARATASAGLTANLPSDADVNASFPSSLEVYDSLGSKQEIPLTWTKTGTNEWTLTVGDPVNPTSNTTTTGSQSGSTSFTIDFNQDGTLAGITDAYGSPVDTAEIDITNWSDGAADSAIQLNLGTANGADGLTQYSSGATTPNIDVTSTTQDGVAYGTLTSLAVDTDGTVRATYANGQNIALYKIAVATFANENGLLLQSGDVYAQTTDSGNALLHVAGEGAAGTIEGSALESSTTDTSTEFSKMIVAQQAYSAAAQVITTSKTMFQSLIDTVR